MLDKYRGLSLLKVAIEKATSKKFISLRLRPLMIGGRLKFLQQKIQKSMVLTMEDLFLLV